MMRIDKLTTEDIVNRSSAIKVTRQYLKEIIDWFSQESLDSFPWNKIKAEAINLRNAIENMYKIVIETVGGRKKIKDYSAKSKNEYLKNITDTYKLQALLTKAYIFIQKLREKIKNEKLNYLIMIDDKENEKSSIKKVSLAQLLPTLNARMTKDNEFNIQINDSKALAKLVTQESQIDDKTQTIYNQIIQLTKDVQEKRRSYVSEKRTREKGYKKNEKAQSGYEIGQAGKAFEIAANAVADAIVKGIKLGDKAAIELAVEKFKVDTSVFYQAGDIEPEYVEAIFTTAKNLALELKRVTLGKDGLGARLIGKKTIVKALNDIIKDIESGELNKDIKERLEIRFSKKDKILSEEINTRADEIAIDVINSVSRK